METIISDFYVEWFMQETQVKPVPFLYCVDPARTALAHMQPSQYKYCRAVIPVSIPVERADPYGKRPKKDRRQREHEVNYVISNHLSFHFGPGTDLRVFELHNEKTARAFARALGKAETVVPARKEPSGEAHSKRLLRDKRVEEISTLLYDHERGKTTLDADVVQRLREERARLSKPEGA